MIAPVPANWMAPTPPVPDESSEFDTYTQPPPAVAKQAPPSGEPCQVYVLLVTVVPVRATTRDVKPAGNWMLLASAAPSAP